MPWFAVTLGDGSTTIMQAHSITHLRAALPPGGYTKIERRRRCRRCRKAAAAVQRTLCPACWEEVLDLCRTAWKDLSMSEQALQETAMSYFVES